jgi:hypothetical protein
MRLSHRKPAPRRRTVRGATTALRWTLALATSLGPIGLAQALELPSLGPAGIRIAGASADAVSGFSVAGCGDVNGDGRPDLVVGAPGGHDTPGSAYVVFTQSPPANVDLAALGTHGFRIVAPSAQPGQFEGAGVSVAGAGDVNGDDLSDVVVGVPHASSNGRQNSGSAYVVFGKRSSASVDLAALGANGFRIDGAIGDDFPDGVFGDQLGRAVAGAGDVNGDGLADVVIGTEEANQRNGRAWVVFGSASNAPVDVGALGDRGFAIEGTGWAGGFLGASVAGAGDVDRDGLSDILIGAPYASPNGRVASGTVYVVFGKASAGTVDTAALDTQGFRIDGAADDDALGESVSAAGDVNGDGFEDLIVGRNVFHTDARLASAYVVFGRTSPRTVDLATLDTQGFRIDGTANGDDELGRSVAGAGDVDGDGLADVIVGAPNRGRTDDLYPPGSAYVVFGKVSTATVDLTVPSPAWVRMDGGIGTLDADGDQAGVSVAGAGDVDRDGVADVIVGAPFTDGLDRVNAGAAYVVYGVRACDEDADPPPQGEAAELLERFKPVLMLDPDERFLPLDVAGMAEHRRAALQRDDDTRIDAPGLAALRAVYADGVPASEGDDLVAGTSSGCGVVCTAAALERCHGSRIYGRVLRTSAGARWLQFWIFYYHQDHGAAGFTAHEGDWETIQLHLPAGATTPDSVLYSQGEDGESCAWTALERQGTRPVFYVAAGSHGVYARPGVSEQDPLPPDRHRGGGRAVDPRLAVLSDDAPAWVAWPGRWGSTDGKIEGSPHGPAFEDDGDRWDAPDALGWPACR